MRLATYLTPEEKTGNRLRELWIEIGPACHLSCSFCFNSAGRECQFKHKQMHPVQYLSVLGQFAALGGKVIGIPGFGEPFFGQNLETTKLLIEGAELRGLRCHVFTAGDILSEDLIEWLRDKPVSLGIKFNHFDAAIQDGIVGSPGYAVRREAVLARLREASFYGNPQAETTRISFVTSVLDENAAVLPDIYRYCRRNGIVPDIDTLLPAGRAATLESDYQAKASAIFTILKEIDRDEFGIDWEINAPIYAGENCDRCLRHLYVDFRGRVSPCLGANKHGSFLGDVFQPLRSHWDSPFMAKIRSRHYEGACVECGNFQSGKCNSCLGRFATIDGDRINTLGCPNRLVQIRQ